MNEIEQLEKRVAELIEERDAYNVRRCEALELVEKWRKACHKLGKSGYRIISANEDFLLNIEVNGEHTLYLGHLDSIALEPSQRAGSHSAVLKCQIIGGK